MAIETLRPNGVGDSSQCEPVPEANNYTRVDEDPHDGSATIVQRVLVGAALDLYALPNSGIGAGLITNVRLTIVTVVDETEEG